jgi:uncharacterized protein with ParB-like and HNH nuclease domain
MENNKFKTEVSTLENLAHHRFIIPSYQRPYVWGEEQISKLLFDFYDAFTPTDEKYYVGTVLLYEQKNSNKSVFQLIDGQQRFTTLWLIASAFKMLKSSSEITNFLKVGDELRLDFAIRKQIKAYLFSLLEKQITEKNQYSDTEIESDEYLTHIAQAITTIVSKLQIIVDTSKIDAFGNFIYKKVQFVTNIISENSDLNKIFMTANNSGIQLEQSDILKSLLLKSIKTEKTLYSRIWEVCENMNNYFERNVKQLFPTEFEWTTIEYDTLKNIPTLNQEETQSQNNSDNAYSIADILGGNYAGGQDEQKLSTEYGNGNCVYCRSIITFPQLLLHAYRIFLKQKGEDDFYLPFHTKNLIQIFKLLVEKDEEVIKEFFKCLWEVRFVFDKEVVKWIQQGDDKEEVLLLSNISKSDGSFIRVQKDKSEVSMLQNMLYFTGNYNTQIWLTPYLYLLDKEDSLQCLEKIDNEMSLSKLTDKETSYSLMDPNFCVDKVDFENYLKESKGTKFRHYWFQKLEYILWKEFSKKPTNIDEEKFKKYRITSKNSIEHVFPQHHEFDHKIEEKYLNDFGNLVLLNVSQNSSYSNQDIQKKKFAFDNKQTYDSLKLALIYQTIKNPNDWNSITIEKHREEMIEKIKTHYSSQS